MFEDSIVLADVAEMAAKLCPRVAHNESVVEFFPGAFLYLVAVLTRAGVGEVLDVDAAFFGARKHVALLTGFDPSFALESKLAGNPGPGLRGGAGAGHAGHEVRVGGLEDLAAAGACLRCGGVLAYS